MRGAVALVVDLKAALVGKAALPVNGRCAWHSACSVIHIASLDAKGGVDYDASGSSSVIGTQLTLEGASQFRTGTGNIFLSKAASVKNLGAITVDIASGAGYSIADDDHGSITSFTNQGTATIYQEGSRPFGITTEWRLTTQD